MINIVAGPSPITFEKVSYEQFKKDFLNCNNIDEKKNINENIIKDIYDNIKLPERKTEFSAGYDFVIPYDITLDYGNCAIIPTGIRCKMNDDLVLMIYPRSSIGFKYGIRLANTVGIIDSDYYNADNEGHIMIKIVRDEVFEKVCKTFTTDNTKMMDMIDFDDSHKTKVCTLEAGSNFVQGIFTNFVTGGEIVDNKRTGGIGSTTKKE